jgi:exodeoxyribonuclease V gamma subunit
MSGGVTFGALLPMRSIPAKVLCLLGMNQDAFPRQDRPLGFDLMAANPRSGDRSRRNDDKYLFLEALISARHRLTISYIGQDVQDNTTVPPSVLVSELLDYIAEGYHRSEEAMTTRHRLQAFSPAYFTSDDPSLFSFSRASREAAQNLMRARLQKPERLSFVDDRLPEWDADFTTVDIETLVNALCHPCRFLLENRLQVRLRENSDPTDDRESFVLSPLDRYALGQTIVHASLDPSGNEDSVRLAARGRLPHGDPGHRAFELLHEDADELVTTIRSLQDGDKPDNVPVRVGIDGYTLTGLLGPIHANGQLCYRFSKGTSRDVIGAWLRHLLWCHLAASPMESVTFLIDRGGIRTFHAVENPDAELQRLLSIYGQAVRQPVPLFPVASWEYAQWRFLKGLAVDAALERVKNQWRQSFHLPGEAEDPYIRLCYGDGEPLGSGFVAMAEAVYGPIMRASQIDA